MGIALGSSNLRAKSTFNARETFCIKRSLAAIASFGRAIASAIQSGRRRTMESRERPARMEFKMWNGDLLRAPIDRVGPLIEPSGRLAFGPLIEPDGEARARSAIDPGGASGLGPWIEPGG